jgi:hypothetical protein
MNVIVRFSNVEQILYFYIHKQFYSNFILVKIVFYLTFSKEYLNFLYIAITYIMLINFV